MLHPTKMPAPSCLDGQPNFDLIKLVTPLFIFNLGVPPNTYRHLPPRNITTMLEAMSRSYEFLGSLQSIVATPCEAILAATTIFSLIAAIHVFRTWWRLRHIPGPFLNSITPLVMTYHCFKEDITTYTYNLTREYGPLVRVQPNVVVYDNPETLRRICSVKANYTKGLWFEFSRWHLERYSCLAMRDNESRKERKTKLLPAASGPVPPLLLFSASNKTTKSVGWPGLVRYGRSRRQPGPIVS